MKGTVEDFDILKAIQPQQVVAYLYGNGWREKKRIANHASVWMLENDSEKKFQILLPLDPEFDDFPLRMSKVLQTIEFVEQRSQLEILIDVQTALADIIRIRVNHPMALDGTMPLYDIFHLIEHARNMIISAARSAVEPRPYYQGRLFEEVDEYLRKVHMGQTERGSYILNIISPIVPSPTSSEKSEVSSELFERKVTKSLAQALAAIQTASQEAMSTGDMAAFNDIIDDGVSGNLCQAIVGINESGGDRGLDISLRWCPTLVQPENMPRQIILPPDTMPVIKEASEHLKRYPRRKRSKSRQGDRTQVKESIMFIDQKLSEFVQIEGLAIGLERLDGSETGKVTIMESVNGKQRKIELELNDSEYSLAVQAHQDRVTIICVGQLCQENNLFTLKNPRNFRLSKIDR